MYELSTGARAVCSFKMQVSAHDDWHQENDVGGQSLEGVREDESCLSGDDSLLAIGSHTLSVSIVTSGNSAQGGWGGRAREEGGDSETRDTSREASQKKTRRKGGRGSVSSGAHNLVGTSAKISFEIAAVSPSSSPPAHPPHPPPAHSSSAWVKEEGKWERHGDSWRGWMLPFYQQVAHQVCVRWPAYVPYHVSSYTVCIAICCSVLHLAWVDVAVEKGRCDRQDRHVQQCQLRSVRRMGTQRPKCHQKWRTAADFVRRRFIALCSMAMRDMQ